jgi:hypothetical protein
VCVFDTPETSFSDEERMEKNCGPYLALTEGVPTLRKIDLAKCKKSFED